MVACKDGTAVRLVSRAGKDHTRRFAELAAAIPALPPVRPEDVTSTPAIYMAFDCLYLEGRDLRPLSLHERRTELRRVLENDWPYWRMSRIRPEPSS